MRTASRLWISCWIAAAALPFHAAPARAGVTWLRLSASCSSGPGEISTPDGSPGQVIRCGNVGSFVFGPPGLAYSGACGNLRGTTETPVAIADEITPPLAPAFPCSLGRCLGHKAGDPWIAMVDWSDDHGWSVAATIREASDRQVGVELYNLEASSPVTQPLPSVSDLHALVQLCALEEHVKTQPFDRPLAVNLSFGRRARAADSSGLGGAVTQVLSQLVSDGVLPVAAAGNHREMLFPAKSAGVVSAGAVDLSWFQQGGQPIPSAQTPSGTAALMLGYGLYLSTDTPGNVWAVPPGNSYAAALFTGWIGGYLAGGGTLPQAAMQPGARWTPVLTDPTDGLGRAVQLALNGVPLAGSALAGPRTLFDRALYGPGTPPASKPGIPLKLTMTAPSSPFQPLLYADTGNNPQPGVCPCIPCGPGGGPGGQTTSGSGTLTLDLSSSRPLPTGMSLIRLFLRLGEAVYAFDRSGYSEVLDPIAAGNAASLTLSGLDGYLKPGQQPSLVFEINVNGQGGPYWHEIPIDLPSP